jgi:diguanylate cyclase (GGDEF)-like protein
MAERIRQEIAGRPVRREEASVTITLSIGLLWLPEAPGGSLEPLLGEADRALYRAKAEGRDRVVMVISPGRDKPALSVAPQL